MSTDKPHIVNKSVLVNGGQYMGRIVKVHTTPTGEHRYQVRWHHPSERQPQKGWFDHGEIQ
jgi:hypothetical protein